MAIQYQVQSELEALSAQSRFTSNRLSDQRTALFGTNRMGEISAQLGNKRQYDAWSSFITDSTNASSISKYKNEMKKNFHLQNKYLIQAITRMSGLVLYYPLNESVSGTVRDYGPNVLNGVATNVTPNTSGQAGRSYSFDGNADVVTRDDNSLLNLTTNSITLFAIVKKLGAGDSQEEIIKKDGQYLLRFNSTDHLEFITWADTAAHKTTHASTYPAGWHTTAGVYDDTAINSTLLYIDGTVVNSLDTQTGNLQTTSNQLYIGSDGLNGEDLNGQIQHVAIFNRPLTQSELIRLTQVAGLI